MNPEAAALAFTALGPPAGDVPARLGALANPAGAR